LLAGVLNGLIVLGGGVLITPLLFVTGVRPQIAVGTSLAALTMLSCIGFSAHLLLDSIALGLVPIVAAVLGGAVRSMIGSKILARLTPPWMLMLFAIVRVPVAVRLIDQGLGTALLGTVIPSGAPLRAYAAFGVFAGILSGIFGVGGGGFFMFIGIMLARKGWAVGKNAGNGGSASA